MIRAEDPDMAVRHALNVARGVLFFLCLVLLVGRAAIHGQRRATADTSAAATQFLSSLSEPQRAKAAFAFTDAERVNWHFIPRSRRGLSLKEMTPAQRQAGQNLLKSTMSARGLKQSAQIMNELELVLQSIEGSSTRDPGLYFFSIFGTPGATATWGWRVEGHHVSLNFTIVDGMLTAWTPQFFGANPAEVMQGPHRGLRVLAGEEDRAFQLLHALDASQRQTAVLRSRVPGDIFTGNDRTASRQSPDGLAAARMTPAQQEMLRDLVAEYAARMVDEIATERMRRIEAAGFDKVTFAWIGGDALHEPHYYRVQGPTFLIEFDNVQSGGNHIHSVWRDFNGDFGDDVLKRHYQTVAHLQ
jgi:hypothetical protein